MATDYWRMTIGRCPTCRRETLVHSFRFDVGTEAWAYAGAECTFGCPRSAWTRPPQLSDRSRPSRAPQAQT